MKAKAVHAVAASRCFGELFLFGLGIGAEFRISLLPAFLSGLPTLFLYRIHHRSSVGIR